MTAIRNWNQRLRGHLARLLLTGSASGLPSGFAKQHAAATIDLPPSWALHLDPRRRSAGAVELQQLVALLERLRVQEASDRGALHQICKATLAVLKVDRAQVVAVMVHEVERPQHGLQYRVSGCTCWSLEGGQERELEAQLQGANKTFRPELNAGLASPIEAGFDKPRAEPLAFRSRHPWSTQLPPDEPCLAGFGQLPSNANLAGAIGQGAILGGVGGKLMQTQRQR